MPEKSAPMRPSDERWLLAEFQRLHDLLTEHTETLRALRRLKEYFG